MTDQVDKTSDPAGRIIRVATQPDLDRSRHDKRRRGFFRATRAEWTARATKLFVVAALGLTAVQWVDTVYIAGSDFLTFQIAPDTAFDPDTQKMSAANWASYTATRAAARDHRPGERVLAFRESEFGYYTDVPFLYFLDDKMVPLYLESDPREVIRMLREHDVRQMLVPDYPLAQIENSAFEQILGDPAFTQVTFEFGGWRIYALRETVSADLPETLIAEDFRADPAALENWNNGREALPLASALTTGNASLIRDSAAGYVEVRRARRFYARPEIVDTLQRGELVLTQPAFLTNEYDFDASEGLMALEAEIEGDGYFEAVVISSTRDDVEEYVEEQVVWRGVLFAGEPRTIHAQFSDLDLITRAAAFDTSVRRHRIAFRIRDAGYLRLYSWRVSRWREDVSPAFELARAYVEPLRNGWTYMQDDPSIRILDLGLALRDPDPADALNAVRIRRFDSRSVDVRSPPFILPTVAYDIDALDTTDQLARAAQPIIRADLDMDGRGMVRVSAELQCFGERADVRGGRERAGRRSTIRDMIGPMPDELEGFGAPPAGIRSVERRGEDEEPEPVIIEISRILLEGRPRQEALEFSVPCMPLTTRLIFNVERNDAYVQPDLALADVTIGDIDMTLRRLTADGLAAVPLSPVLNAMTATGASGPGDAPAPPFPLEP